MAPAWQLGLTRRCSRRSRALFCEQSIIAFAASQLNARTLVRHSYIVRMQNPDWPTLRHAYGSASDIPSRLEHARHAAPPRDYRDEPWYSLWSALCHQGDVYSASYAAVPELVAIAEQRRSESRVSIECLYMAAIIELERAAPEGLSTPPEIAPELVTSYQKAIAQGAKLAADLLSMTQEREEVEMLRISVAALCGDLVSARLLAAGPTEAE